jgi:hypothetical protein
MGVGDAVEEEGFVIVGGSGASGEGVDAGVSVGFCGTICVPCISVGSVLVGVLVVLGVTEGVTFVGRVEAGVGVGAYLETGDTDVASV